MLQQSMACCGCDEIHGIEYYKNPEDVLKEVFPYWADYDHSQQGRIGSGPPLLVFTEAVRYGGGTGRMGEYGSNLSKYIEKHKLGSVVASKIKINPNSDNSVRAWLWSVSATGYKTWARKQKWYKNWKDEPDGYLW